MSLSAGGWTSTAPPGQTASPLGREASTSGCNTVLMSVKVSVCHSGIRPLCLPGAADEYLRLQLSMDPGKAGEFRLSLRDITGATAGRSVFIAEFDLKTVRYEVKSPLCHELSLASPQHDRFTFNFRCEQEAHEWATVVMSSLREAQRVSVTSPTEEVKSSSQHQAPHNSTAMPQTEEMCVELVSAIESGDVGAATACASLLAKQKAALCIQPSKQNYPDMNISLAVVVEDASSSCCVTVKVSLHATIGALKQQVFTDYGFHPRVQRWVIGQCLCSDHRSLASYGVQRDGDTAFLYLISAHQAHLSRGLYQKDQDSTLLMPALVPTSQQHHFQGAVGNVSAAHNKVSRPYSTLPTRLHNSHNISSNSSGVTDRLSLGGIRDLINLQMPQLNEALSPNRTNAQLGWACPTCTYINKPTRPGCEMCSTDRPEGYTVPGNYRPDALELRRIQQEKEAIRQYHQEKGRREDLRGNNSLLHNLDQDY